MNSFTNEITLQKEIKTIAPETWFYVVGVDLGSVNDSTAITVLEVKRGFTNTLAYWSDRGGGRHGRVLFLASCDTSNLDCSPDHVSGALLAFGAARH